MTHRAPERRKPRPAYARVRRRKRWLPWVAGALSLALGLAALSGISKLGGSWRHLVLSGALLSDARGEPRAPELAPMFGGIDLDALANAITEIDVARARELSERYRHVSLSVAQAQRLAIERARLALYVGDCDGAEATLSSLSPEVDQVAGLLALSRSCAGAVAAARVIEDHERGVWVRLQDASDEPLVPYIARVAERAREAVRMDLGIDLPRPLRIDVVRDLFSLSSVSGLPLDAAETTGTVAVARWGRVTLLSPRAARHGYPWQDTLAHEIVHLALSRATRDFAPLWLQEGVAKRQEQRWREARPFDDAGTHDQVARRALQTGNSVGVQNLGPSIAMLPSADAASIAFSEVTSFVNFWIERNGRAAFRLLLADLEGLEDRDSNAALRSVSGLGLEEWIATWQAHLQATETSVAAAPLPGEGFGPDMKSVRLGDLLLRGQHFDAAARLLGAARESAPRMSAMRYRASQAELAAGRKEAAVAQLGELSDVDGPHAGWFALSGRFRAEAGDHEAAARDSEMALSLDPWSELVACEGHLRGLLGADPWELPDPVDPERRRLCLTARARPAVQ